MLSEFNGIEHSLSYSLLVSPMLLLLIMIVASLIGLRRPKFGSICTVCAGIILYVLATPFVASRLIVSLENDGSRSPEPPGAIVVLSGDFETTALPSPGVGLGLLTLERLDIAAKEYRAAPLPVLVSGGPVEGTTLPAANLMASALINDFEVPVRWQETRSRTTFENAEFSAKLLKKAGISTVILVTQRWHMRRASWAFGRFGIQTAQSKFAPKEIPTDGLGAFIPSVSSLLDSRYAIHEILGLIYYRLAK